MSDAHKATEAFLHFSIRSHPVTWFRGLTSWRMSRGLCGSDAQHLTLGSMRLLGRGSLPGLGLNTSKHLREQEEDDGACCPPAENADDDGLCRRDRKPDQSRET